MVRDSAEYEVDPDVEASEFDAGYCGGAGEGCLRAQECPMIWAFLRVKMG